MPVARADQRPAAGADPPADQRARVGGRVVGIDQPVRAEPLVELEHVDARRRPCTVRFSRSSSWIWFIRLRSTHDPAAAAGPRRRSGRCRRRAARPGRRSALAIRTIAATSSVLSGRTTSVGQRARPSDGPGTAPAPGRGCSRSGFDVIRICSGAEDRARARSTRSSSRSAVRHDSPPPRRAAVTRSMPERLGEQLVDVDDVDLAAPRRPPTSGRSDHGQALTSVSTSSSAALLQPPLARSPRSARASRPAARRRRRSSTTTASPGRRRVKSSPGIARRISRGSCPDALALVQPARVVVGDRALDRARRA